jgi:hypothetical protein
MTKNEETEAGRRYRLGQLFYEELLKMRAEIGTPLDRPIIAIEEEFDEHLAQS